MKVNILDWKFCNKCCEGREHEHRFSFYRKGKLYETPYFRSQEKLEKRKSLLVDTLLETSNLISALRPKKMLSSASTSRNNRSYVYINK